MWCVGDVVKLKTNSTMGATLRKATLLAKQAVVVVCVVCFFACPLCVISTVLAVSCPFLPRRIYARFAALLQEQFLVAFVYAFERGHSRLKIYVSGDKPEARGVGEQSGALIVSNHVAAHADWAPIYSLVARQGHGALGGFRCVVKDIAKWIPGFGWGMWLMNWPFLKRNWASDKEYLKSKLQAYRGIEGVPLSLLIFPEGTRWTSKKHAQAVAFAKERQLYIPKHTMCPRYKGFQALVRGLHSGNCADVVYDATLFYTGFNMKPGRKGPGTLNVFVHDVKPGAPECAFHIHVRKLNLAELNAKDDVELKKELFEWFKKKDLLIEEFLRNSKRFPQSTKLQPMAASRWVPALLLMVFLFLVFVYSVNGFYRAYHIILLHHHRAYKNILARLDRHFDM